MHTYFESIGLNGIKTARQTERLVHDAVMHFDDRVIYRNDLQLVYAEFTKFYAPDMGLRIAGEFDDSGTFHPEYFFPFFLGKTVSLKQPLEYEKLKNSEAYGAVCDDPRVGCSIIFHLTNNGEFMKRFLNGKISDGPTPVKFAALASSGTILLPVFKTPKAEMEGIRSREKYLKMVSDARDGNEEAMEALTEDDMKNYNVLSKRVQEEDILSIVDTYFQPFGIECDIYNICGNVISCETVVNTYTSEKVWKMQIEACDIYFDLCINEGRLEGVPTEGSRFRGTIWLQGEVQYR